MQWGRKTVRRSDPEEKEKEGGVRVNTILRTLKWRKTGPFCRTRGTGKIPPLKTSKKGHFYPHPP